MAAVPPEFRWHFSEGTMTQIFIERQRGEWPALNHLIGSTVSVAKLRLPDLSLILTFVSGEIIMLPPFWQYSSCLLATSSDEFIDHSKAKDPDRQFIEIGSTLMGLEGAKLSRIESDKSNLDLVFNSIRISLVTEFQQNHLP